MKHQPIQNNEPYNGLLSVWSLLKDREKSIKKMKLSINKKDAHH